MELQSTKKDTADVMVWQVKCSGLAYCTSRRRRRWATLAAFDTCIPRVPRVYDTCPKGAQYGTCKHVYETYAYVVPTSLYANWRLMPSGNLVAISNC